ncbi:RNA polymerase Rpb4 [Chaetomium sp. MPI-SDFR-AT-0129]|nr:RNA polymerase Rpb4 [Chaetomium sp. MPI-SDFR-AT-0129]
MSHEDVRRHAPVSGPRAKPRELETAEEELKLGEFQNVPCLSMSEAALLVKAILDRRTRRGVNRVWSEYFDAFAYFRHAESIEAVERLVGAHQELASFEKAQLSTLRCTDAEEAERLIPSLTDKISNEDLQILLDDIHAIRLLDAERA